MFGQLFTLSDIPRVAALAVIEILLSADNAIVLGVLVHTLPAIDRKKALYIGLASAFVLRALTIFLASFILQSHWLEIIGGAYLIFLGLQHFISKKRKQKSISAQTSFWKTVLLIEIFDLLFAIDSIIAGIAFIAGDTIVTSSTIHPKLWIVYAGGMLGVFGMRYAADLFSKLLSRFPNLEMSAYLLIIWIGLKLCILAIIPHILAFEIAFWILFSITLLAGFWRKELQ
jgi:YkoY family integral membrane protein